MNQLTRFFAKALSAITGKGGSGGGGQLPPQAPPKLRPRQQSFPGHMTTQAPADAALPKNDLSLANRDVTQFRFGASTSEVIRTLVRADPDMSGALSSHLRMGIPERYCAYAHNPDGSFNEEATRLVHEIMARFDKAPGYDVGFSNTGSMRSVAEALAKDCMIEGAMAMELVLDKGRLPSSLAPIAFKAIKFYDDHSGGTRSIKPIQDVGGEEVDLDLPNVFMVWIDASLLDVYPHPPMEAAIQPVLSSQQFLNDLRRVLARHIYPRYNCSIDTEKLMKMIPPEVLHDKDQREAYFESVIASVQAAINGLQVEDALVSFDYITVEFIKGQDGDVPDTFETVRDIINGKLATGAKTMPSMLGHGAGTQNIASTETMLAMVTANSLVRLKLQEMFSKAFTLAARLFGHDVTVSFEYDPIDLRPDTELEAFKSQRQSRLTEQLSMGVISDVEYSLRLTGRFPANMPGLSGTMFRESVPAEEGGNSYSGTGVGGGQSGGGASNQSRKPGTPAKKRGD